MLVINISIHIMDPQIAKCNTAPQSFVFCNNRYPGAVHLVWCRITFAYDICCSICNFKIFNNDMFCIIQ